VLVVVRFRFPAVDAECGTAVLAVVLGAVHN